MNILFRTGGGQNAKKELGLGHIFRCLNLANSSKNTKISFLIEDYGGAKLILQKNGIKDFDIFFNEPSIEKDLNKTTSIIEKKKIDIVIVDRYKIKNTYLKKIKSISKLVVISDLYRINYYADLVVNGFVGYQNKIIYNKFNAKCLLGPKYQILNPDFKKNINHKKKNDILITFGGMDGKQIITSLKNPLEKYGNSFKIKIILGPITKKSKSIIMLQMKFPNTLKILQETKHMQKEISDSKFGICGGGLTTYEFASQNVPFAVICGAKHQLMTASAWKKYGTSFNLGMYNNKTSKKIEKIFENILTKNFPKWQKSRLVDGKGTDRIIIEIEKLLKYPKL